MVKSSGRKKQYKKILLLMFGFYKILPNIYKITYKKSEIHKICESRIYFIYPAINFFKKSNY